MQKIISGNVDTIKQLVSKYGNMPLKEVIEREQLYSCFLCGGMFDFGEIIKCKIDNEFYGYVCDGCYNKGM